MSTGMASLRSAPGEQLSVAIFEEAGDAFVLFDLETELILDVNPAAQRLSGYTRPLLIGKPFEHFLRSEAKSGLQDLRLAFKKMGTFHAEYGFHFRQRTERGWIPVSLTVTCLHILPKPLGLMTVRDISKQQKLLVQLRQAEAELRRLHECVPDYLWSGELSPSGEWIGRYYSPVVERITGRPPEFYLPGPERWLSTIHPEDRARMQRAFHLLASGAETESEEEYRVLRPDGRLCWVRNIVRVTRNLVTGHLCFNGIVTEITERKLADLALRSSEERFRTLVEKSSEAIALMDENGQLTYASPSTQTVLGIAPAEFVGQMALARVHPADLPRIEELFKHCLASPGQDIRAEFRYRHHNGNWVYLDARGINRLAEPGIRSIVCNFRDITDRKRAEDEMLLLQTIILAFSEIEDFHTALTVALQRICKATDWCFAQVWLPRPDLEVLECSPAFYCGSPGLHEFHEVSRGMLFAPGVGLPGRVWSTRKPAWIPDVTLDDNFPRSLMASKVGFKAGMAVPICSGPAVLAVLEFFVLETRREDEQLVRLVFAVAAQLGTVVERRWAEEAMRESEQRYRALVENSYDLIAEVCSDGRFTYLSPNYQDVLGYMPDELIGRRIEILVHPEDYATLLTQIEKTDGPLTYRLRHKSGEWRWFENIGKRYKSAEGPPRSFIFSRDISSRKIAEDALAHEHDLLHMLMESVPHLVYFKDTQSRFTRINRAQASHLGLTDPAQALGRTDFDFYPAELAASFLADEQHILQTGRPLIDKIERQTGDDANERWLSSTKVPVFEKDGGISGIVGISRDVTEKQKVEEAVRASEVKYRTLIENLEQGIYLKDRQLRFVVANRPFCELVGLFEEQLVGRTYSELFPMDLVNSYEAEDSRVLQDGQPRESEEEHIYGGKKRILRISRTPVKDTRGQVTGLLGILWDVTQQRSLEAGLLQSQKMEAVGQLAGGVAHDFNNLMTIILGYLGLLQSSAVDNQRMLSWLRQIEIATLRAAELTSKLLGFSRRATLRLEPTNLNICVEETMALLRPTIDPRVSLHSLPCPAPWPVQTDVGQINQVLMNLAINARDAMEGGGTLTLSTANVSLTEEEARYRPEARAGDFVRLSVCDTGNGIPPAILPHIFEPFFTTKAPGKGTGLGLAMVFGIVKQHHGWIECQSRLGEGTQFDVYLPRLASELASGANEAAPMAILRGRERILIVDDELMIRTLGRAILQSYGYEPLLAENGEEAIELYRREFGTIDLIVLDLTMPRLSGRETMERLLEIDPKVKVLFASGYSAEDVTPTEREQVLGFVSKPYRPEELVHCIRTALDCAPMGSWSDRLATSDPSEFDANSSSML